MKSQKLINGKKLKARLRNKDYIKKINIKRNNWPTPEAEEVEPILYLSKVDGKIEFQNRKAMYKVIGEKTIKIKLRKNLLSQGDGILPKSKKYRLSRKEK